MNALNDDLNESLKTERTLLGLLGFYPQKESKSRLQNFAMKICLLVGAIQQTSMIADIIAAGGDVERLSDILFFFLTHTLYLTKITIFFRRTPDYLYVEHDLLKKLVLHDCDQRDGEIIQIRARNCARVTAIYRMFTVYTVLSVPLVLLDQSKRGSPPLPGYIPFDTTKYYYLIVAFQELSLCLCAYINGTLDCLTWMWFANIAALFDILKTKLLRFSVETQENWTELAKFHDNILKLTSKIQFIFSKGIFCQLFASVIVLCFTNFQLMVTVKFPSMNFMFLITYLFCMLIQIAFYCWFGNEIIISSDDIGKYFFMSDWYGANLNSIKSMSIMLERAKKPVRILAEGFFPLSLSTLISIFRSSYNYLIVLKQLYDE